MGSVVIGLDTSNYRTSTAAVTLTGKVLINSRKLLPVPSGEKGLRQSDAVFAHLRQLHEVLEPLRGISGDCRIVAAAVSTRPRDTAESYMPVFQVGDSVARAMAALLNIPCYTTDHQHGHIQAAVQGTQLGGKDHFLALHLSGGTTDLLHVEGEHITALGSSLDLHIGQLVDRVGVAMGLPFPSGEKLEKLAERGESFGLLGCSMDRNDLDCHLSGAETQALKWIQSGNMSRENIAREIYDLMVRTAIRMLRAGKKQTGEEYALICGGVASSALFRFMLQERRKKMRDTPVPVFGQEEYSGDNAVGVALIGVRQYLQTGGLL